MDDASGGGEFAAIERIRALFPEAPAGDTWIGDDAAVVRIGAGIVVAAADALVEGVHFDLSLTSVADAGWKALAVNLSDLAAMGCRGLRALVTVSGPPSTDLAGLYGGLAAAAARFGCPVVGGDLTGGPALVVSVSVLGDGAVAPPPVLRGGARAGDEVWVTGPLGAAARALRLRGSVDLTPHARPVPRVEEGVLARGLGATAMIDVSDGFAADLGHILTASRVGVSLSSVPVASGASLDEAVGGGDDYELVFCMRSGVPVGEAFVDAGLRPPVLVGRVVPDPAVRLLDGQPFAPTGWEHRFG